MSTVRLILEIIGWTGSALIIWSLTQARVLRFRVLNLAGAALATLYNGVLGIWPFMAMNAVIAVIDVYWLRRLLRDRDDPEAYSVVEVSPTDGYLRHVLGVHLEDIHRFQPSYAVPADDAGADRRWAFLVQREAETVGAVVVRDEGDGRALVELDYVTERFRDCSPGQFVYEHSGAFDDLGLRRLEAAPELATWTDYLTRVGFRRDGDTGAWVRDLAAA
jgi:hypothetical protein